MRLLAILLLAIACTHEPTVPPARVARGPSERDLREGGMHAVCVQNALSACSRLECPACENLLSSGATCAAGTAAAVAAMVGAKAAGGHENQGPLLISCPGANAVDDCRRQCTACADARDRCGD